MNYMKKTQIRSIRTLRLLPFSGCLGPRFGWGTLCQVPKLDVDTQDRMFQMGISVRIEDVIAKDPKVGTVMSWDVQSVHCIRHCTWTRPKWENVIYTILEIRVSLFRDPFTIEWIIQYILCVCVSQLHLNGFNRWSKHQGCCRFLHHVQNAAWPRLGIKIWSDCMDVVPTCANLCCQGT